MCAGGVGGGLDASPANIAAARIRTTAGGGRVCDVAHSLFGCYLSFSLMIWIYSFFDYFFFLPHTYGVFMEIE